jgi:large subunit ribosomal protein L6
MSRIGKTALAVPSGVNVTSGGGRLVVKGPKGEVQCAFPRELTLTLAGDGRSATVERAGNGKRAKSLHGTYRRLLENMVVGVSKPYVRELEIIGVGYQARLTGKSLTLQVGYANAVQVPIPAGVTVECPTNTMVKATGCDKAVLGQFAADVRRVRPPEPYNGKGIRYRGEQVQRKAGKSFVNSE